MQLEHLVSSLISSGRLVVDVRQGVAYSPYSNTPSKCLGSLTKKGYVRICITVEGKQAHAMLHRVVWCAVNGPVPDGMQIDHLNGVKTDNRIANLQAVDQPENMRRARINGLLRPVKHSSHHAAKLTSEDIVEIRMRSHQGESGASLGRSFGISGAHARRIARGERWCDQVQSRVGKKAAGRLLDGREHNEFPEVE